VTAKRKTRQEVRESAVAYVAAEAKPYFKTRHGEAVQGRAEDVLQLIPDGSVDLIFTSPPYALHFKKEYGNVNRTATLTGSSDTPPVSARTLRQRESCS
jgi:16S rRNA G966 N2-methylase RsmD